MIFPLYMHKLQKAKQFNKTTLSLVYETRKKNQSISEDAGVRAKN